HFLPRTSCHLRVPFFVQKSSDVWEDSPIRRSSSHSHSLGSQAKATEFMNTTNDLKMRPFDVQIPNLDGDGIAETIRIDVPVHIDPESGEEILTAAAHELIEKTKARRMGLMLADEIRQLRERFSLTQEQISDLVQIGAKTYTRWESGRARPSRSLNLLL